MDQHQPQGQRRENSPGPQTQKSKSGHLGKEVSVDAKEYRQ